MRSAAGSADWANRRCTQGVSAVPGFTQLTRTPSTIWSFAIAIVKDRTAPLLALYRARFGIPAVAATEHTFVIDAHLLLRSNGSDARTVRTMPTTLTFMTLAHSSDGFASTVPTALIAALLISMSSEEIFEKAAATDASSPTSH